MINNHLFVEEVQKYHPKSLQYLEYWREQKRRIIEGVWIGNHWCPPSLYFYLNFGTIWLKKTRYSKSQIKGQPRNLDYLWPLNYHWMLARGLSGFEMLPDPTEDELKDILLNGSKTGSLGKPLYLNDPKNLILMTGRGSGKTAWAGNEVAREIITGAAREFNPSEVTKADIIIGAFDSKFSDLPCKAAQLALEELPGGQIINGKYYPSPFSVKLSGTWRAGDKPLEHLYEKKINGQWEKKGSRSSIKHRTYRDNPFASQGGRYTLKIAEEIGMWDNLIECHNADENQTIGNSKLGSTLYIGTGGDMGGGTIAAYKMFYEPDAYNCIAIDDIWENKGKIGYFIPIENTKIDYKDQQGITNLQIATTGEDKMRETKKKAKDRSVYHDYVVYNPRVPSEIFLTSTQNIFPVHDLAARLGQLEADKDFKKAEYHGRLVVDELGKIEWKPDENALPIYDYPLTKKENIDGNIVIYEHPYVDDDLNVPYGRYISGLDPYSHAEAETSTSLGSCIVYDRLTKRIVAEYSGRPSTEVEFYENSRRLIKYYNSLCLYENMIPGFKSYLQNKNELYILAAQPSVLKDVIQNSKVHRGFGFHMTEEIKQWGISLINTWLRDEAYDIEGKTDLTNAHKIRSISILKELLMFNPDGNFDRIVALIGVLIFNEEIKKYAYREKDKEDNIKPAHLSEFFNRPKLNSNRVYF